MVVGEASIHNIMGGMESTGGVRLHNHKRKLKQRFDIIKKLGQGTYGKVQLGINKETGQEVAIKTIKKCKIETEADLIRIRREIQIMSSVQHPNIIHIYEVFENREKMVLVMEYAAGGELYDYLSERKVLSEQEARRIFRQIATAVFYCHKHKICHRDLKLENILLDQTGNAKIADFGLSNVFDEQRLLSTFCGSPLYASPEIVKGTPYHGPEVDCWSLGVLLYTLVYGAMPFDGSNFKRLVKQISQSDYFEPKKPSPASPLIKDMLTVCPARRADIEKICTHWWVNEGYEQNCLDIAEDLAAQTPVRLDLLLSLVPQSASAEKLLVGDQQASNDIANDMSSETLVPTRCHSVGSLMELDQNNSDRRIRELLEEEPRATAASSDAKRKLETTPSMDETTAAGVKRKERSRRKERSDEREPRTYRSTSRHHSAPIPNSITEEAMEVEPTVSVPTSKIPDLNQVEAAAACLELIEESKEKSPSKERSKASITNECKQLAKDASMENVEGNRIGREAAVEKPEKKSAVERVDEISSKDVDANSATNETISSGQLEDTRESEGTTKDASNARERSMSQDIRITESAEKEIKKLKEKALSLDSELSNEPAEPPSKPVERRRSKIFETAEKFNQMAASTETDKPKKIFIPGVNVGGAKRVFERKASLSSIVPPPPAKASASKVIIDVPTDKKNEKSIEKSKTQDTVEVDEKLKREEAKKRAVDIITGAIGKPPVQRKINGSSPSSPQAQDSGKMGLKIQLAPNDIRNATVSVTTPVETKFPFDNKSQESTVSSTSEIQSIGDSQSDEPKMSSKMEITLKSATLPRPRKTSKAEITLSGIKSSEPAAFKSEVEAKIDAFQPQKLRTQRSEVAFPVAAAVSHAGRSSSLEPETLSKASPKERIIPIQVEAGHQHVQHSSTPPPKPPMPQRSMSQRSASLSRQSTADSDTDSALGSTVGPEPIRKSPREYIIPIAVEGGGYVTPRSGSVEPESKTSTPTSTNPPRSRFSRPRRMSSLLSDASEDESPFSTLHRDSEDLLQRHMHRLRSSRPSRQPPEHADSLSSGEDDDDDGFELLTAENLFSTLLSRVRSLTQRLNVDDNRSTSFPSSRLLGRLGSNSPQAFWGLNKPLSRRMSESQFKHSLSRDADLFSRKESASSSNPGTPNSPSRGTPTRESIFEIGSNTLPRDKIEHEDVEAETTQMRKEAQESLEQSFTPSLARRLSRQFIEQTRQSLPRSPSIPRERYFRSPTREPPSLAEVLEDGQKQTIGPTTSDQTEYRSRSSERSIRRTNSLLETGTRDRSEHRSPRRSISLFDDDEGSLPPLPRQSMTLGRRYKDPVKTVGRRENFYRTEKIQEEPNDESRFYRENLDNGDNLDTASTSECTSLSLCNSNANIIDATSSVSAKSYETSSTESASNVDCNKSIYKSDASKNFESRLLAAENLIKESKLKNLGPKFNPNLSSNYKDTDKCDKEALGSISDAGTISKRRSYIPSLRLRSGSLTREPSTSVDRRKSFSGSQDTLATRALTPERSILSKLFRAGSKEIESKEKTAKPKQRRISRFLRPDFFDTPREESKYVKEKEAQKAAENERRKSRFMKRKNEGKTAQIENGTEAKPEKELKNEMNSLKKDQSETNSTTNSEDKSKSESAGENTKLKFERQNSKSGFLQSLEKKLEKLRSNDESQKPPVANGTAIVERKPRDLRENSAPPAECLSSELNVIKRAISVEDVPSKNSHTSTSKSKVSSVLSLFKNTDGKQTVNNSRSQSTILSKLKRSPPKSIKAESSTSEDVASTSKIPMKFMKNDTKTIRKSVENKKSPDKIMTDSKKSPPKEKVKEKRTLNDKLSSRDSKKSLPSETSSSISETGIGRERTKKTDSPPKTESSKRASEEIDNSSKTVDNKQTESKSDEKKTIKIKKNISSLNKSNSISKTDKTEESDKKLKKSVKPKSGTEKEEGDGVKKKKIIRVVKKTVKKSSDTSDSKSEEKEKPTKIVTKKVTSTNKETSPETTNVLNKTDKEDGTSANKIIANETALGSTSANKITSNETALGKNPVCIVEDAATSLKLDKLESKIYDAKTNQNSECTSANTTSVLSTKLTESRPNRASLKLDLSKIPQHTFRNSTPKRDSPKTETTKPSIYNEKSNTTLGSPRMEESNVENPSDKLADSVSKMSYHANISGNSIIIDKPLRAKDVAELKKEVTECARIIENRLESQNEIYPQSKEENRLPKEEIRVQKEDSHSKEDIHPRKDEIRLSKEDHSSTKETHLPKEELIDSNKRLEEHLGRTLDKECGPMERREAEPISEYTNETFSPVEEPESFDSWSICSADLNHTRGDLHSPTSPTSYSLYMRGDQPESVIDRIRRRSFYSRFNDRKRASLTLPPPGVTLPSHSTSLSRKYSFNSLKDRDRSKLRNYRSPSRRDRSYSVYSDDILSHSNKSPVKERYTDIPSTSPSSDFKSPVEHYSLTSSYDPLRRYLRSPTLEASSSLGSRRKYHSSDFGTDNEFVSYRSPLSGSLLNDSVMQSHTNRGYGTLPRKFGSSVGNTEPKTVEYYEELLAPTNPDFLARKSPMSLDHQTRCENGYPNGSFDLPHYSTDLRRSYDRTGTDFESHDDELRDRRRCTSQRISETRDLPASTSERSNSCTAD